MKPDHLKARKLLIMCQARSIVNNSLDVSRLEFFADKLINGRYRAFLLLCPLETGETQTAISAAVWWLLLLFEQVKLSIFGKLIT